MIKLSTIFLISILTKSYFSYLAVEMDWVQIALVHGFQHTQLCCLESAALFHSEDLYQLQGLDQCQHTPQPLFDQCHSIVKNLKLETVEIFLVSKGDGSRISHGTADQLIVHGPYNNIMLGVMPSILCNSFSKLNFSWIPIGIVCLFVK